MKGSVLKDTTGENLVVATNTQKQRKCEKCEKFSLREIICTQIWLAGETVLTGWKVLARVVSSEYNRHNSLDAQDFIALGGTC